MAPEVLDTNRYFTTGKAQNHLKKHIKDIEDNMNFPIKRPVDEDIEDQQKPFRYLCGIKDGKNDIDKYFNREKDAPPLAYNQLCDIWSIGITVYTMATGQIPSQTADFMSAVQERKLEALYKFFRKMEHDEVMEN